jgi:hypothetical protein
MTRVGGALVLTLLAIAAAAAEPTASVQLRVYEGFATLGPLYDAQTPYALDVQAEIKPCADGGSRISALDIGGWRYAVQQPCGRTRPERPAAGPAAAVPKAKVIASTGRQPAKPAGAQGRTMMRCDPSTWRCRREP